MMEKQELIEAIQTYISEADEKTFLYIWNQTFEEETLDSIDKESREDFSDILIEEIPMIDEKLLNNFSSMIEEDL